MTQILATFDIDGTLIRNTSGHRYTDAVSLEAGSEPITAACSRVWELVEAGARIYFVTRRERDLLQDVTLRQLRALVHRGIVSQQLLMIPKWRGYEDGRAWTVELLKALLPGVHVGDHDLLNRQAAQDAGVAFLHADAWRDGAPIPITPS